MFRKVRCLLSSGTRSPARSLEYLMHQLSWAASLLRSCRSTSYPAPEPCDTRQTRSDPVLVLRSQVASNEQVEDRLWRLLARRRGCHSAAPRAYSLPLGPSSWIEPWILMEKPLSYGSGPNYPLRGIVLRYQHALPVADSRCGVLPLRPCCVHLQDRCRSRLGAPCELRHLKNGVGLWVVRVTLRRSRSRLHPWQA
jgi:hypothetical protein